MLPVGLAIAWALVQLWSASPVGLLFSELALNEAEARAAHLGFALALAGLIGGGGARLPLGLAGALAGAYLVLAYDALSLRPDAPLPIDQAIGVIGLGLLLRATWRHVGRLPALAGGLALGACALTGDVARLPAALWLSTDGVLGPLLGLSTQYLFLAALFAMLLVATGATASWVALARRLRAGDGPRGAAMDALIAGLPAPSATGAAVSATAVAGPGGVAGLAAAAAALGAVLPPLLGHVVEIVPATLRTAAPGLLAPAALLAALLLVGCRAALPTAGAAARPSVRRIAAALAAAGLGAVLVAALAAGIVALHAVAQARYGGRVSWIAAGGVLVLIALVPRRAAVPAAVSTGRLAIEAGRGLLPVAVLVWGILVEKLDAATVLFWSIGFLLALVARDALAAARGGRRAALGAALGQVRAGLLAGVGLAVPIALATATGGILLAAATRLDLTGRLAAALEPGLAAGPLLPALVVCLLAAGLGLLLPAAAAWLAAMTLLAPVLDDLAARSGAATPVVTAALALLLAVAVGGALSVARRAPSTAWRHSVVLLVPVGALAVALPANPALVGLDGILDGGAALESALAAAGALFGLVGLGRLLADPGRSPRRRALLALAVASLLAPRLWLDPWSPGTVAADPHRLVGLAAAVPPDGGVTLEIGRSAPRAVTLPLGPAGSGAERLGRAGIELRLDGAAVSLAHVVPASAADRAGLQPGQPVVAVREIMPQPSIALVLLPAAALMIGATRRPRARAGRDEGEG